MVQLRIKSFRFSAEGAEERQGQHPHWKYSFRLREALTVLWSICGQLASLSSRFRVSQLTTWTVLGRALLFIDADGHGSTVASEELTAGGQDQQQVDREQCL